MRNIQFFTIFAELNRRPADIAKFRLGPDVRAGAFFRPSIPRARMRTRWVSLARVRRACNPWRLCAISRYFPRFGRFRAIWDTFALSWWDCATLREKMQIRPFFVLARICVRRTPTKASTPGDKMRAASSTPRSAAQALQGGPPGTERTAEIYNIYNKNNMK